VRSYKGDHHELDDLRSHPTATADLVEAVAHLLEILAFYMLLVAF
jgi:hypothetical protein